MVEPYLSHPVRRLRTDPTPDDSVSLVVELDSLSPASLESHADDCDGTVERELGFDAHLVTLPELQVDTFCEVDGVVRIETADTIGITPPPE